MSELPLKKDLGKMYNYGNEKKSDRLEFPLPQSYVDQVLEPFLQRIGSAEGQTILDLAGGRGEAAKFFEQHLPKARMILTSDVNEQALPYKEEGSRLFSAVMSADEQAIQPEFVDIVHIKDSLVHLPDLVKFFDELYRVLKPGGLAVLTFVDTKNSFSLLLAGSVTTNYFSDYKDFLQRKKNIEDFARGNPGVKIGPPFFETNMKKVESALQGRFNILEEGKWNITDKEYQDDWYMQKITPRIKLVLQKI